MSKSFVLSVSDLASAIQPAQKINEYYLKTLPESRWIVRHRRAIAGEQWRPCPDYKNVMASNLGRIKIGNKIAVLRESAAPSDELSRDLLTRLGLRAGKLIVPDVGGTPVHELVASAWLGYKCAGYHVHHISDDGYDNSIYNLMYLCPDMHFLVHSMARSVRSRRTSYVPRYNKK
ncbi:MAG: hypothetical protein IKJ62_00575 [Alphaproteobacteria bacterium]|nr:hypothetical protein [Alphaproteobacteria bacterium]